LNNFYFGVKSSKCHFQLQKFEFGTVLKTIGFENRKETAVLG
jgi:hypothetical protein